MTMRKDVNIMAVPARAGVRAPSILQLAKSAALFDPERPHMGPNELAREIEEDPSLLKIYCPGCHKDIDYALFVAHYVDTKEGPGCRTRTFNTLDITKRRFAGAKIGDTNGNS
jgi:hypothetical protein